MRIKMFFSQSFFSEQLTIGYKKNVSIPDTFVDSTH